MTRYRTGRRNQPEGYRAMSLKFVSEIPAPAFGVSTVMSLINELADRPGEWAEIARVNRNDRPRLTARGTYMKAKDPRVETATRTVDGQVVLFARVNS